MDDKYQQERRQAMGKKPVNVKEGLTRGGKGLLEVELLPNVVVSKVAFNIVLFVSYCISITAKERKLFCNYLKLFVLIHLCLVKGMTKQAKSEIGKIHPPRLSSVVHSSQHLSVAPISDHVMVL